MFAVVTANVLLRYLFSGGLIWGEEAARYLMVWGVMIGVAVAYRARGHIAITMAVDVLPSRIQRGAMLACHLLTIATAALLVYSGFILTRFLGMVIAPTTGLAMSWVYAAVPVGAGLLAVEALRQIVSRLRDDHRAARP